MIDNYDSFSYNLYQYLSQLGANVRVVRNDEVTIEQVEVRFFLFFALVELTFEQRADGELLQPLATVQSFYNAGILKNIVISPGPGHPRTDSGISRPVIRWGLGKVRSSSWLVVSPCTLSFVLTSSIRVPLTLA